MIRSCVIGVLLLYGSTAQAFRLIGAQMEVGKFYNLRNPIEPKYTLLKEGHADVDYGTNEAWDYQVGLLVDTNILETKAGYLYLDQAVIGRSTTHQYRYVHWDWELGISTAQQGLQVFWHHTSQHLLDQNLDEYPLMDLYGVRMCLMGDCRR